MVEGVVARGDGFARHGVVNRGAQVHGLGEEAAEVGLDGEVILLVVVHTARVEALVHGAEAGCFDVGAGVDGGDVAHVEGDVGLAGPAAVLVEVGDFQLVDPYHAVLDCGRVVAHADEQDAHVGEGGVTHHGDGVALVVGVALRVAHLEADAGFFVALGGVALELEVDEIL